MLTIKDFENDVARTSAPVTALQKSRLMEVWESDIGVEFRDALLSGFPTDALKSYVYYNTPKDVAKELEDFKKLLKNTEAEVTINLSDATVEFVHGFLGLKSEVGEVAQAYYKGLFNGVPMDIGELKGELGDALFFITQMARSHGLTLEEVMEANIAKRLKRFPKGFSETDAVNRDIKAENEILGSQAHLSGSEQVNL